jgi:ELWxxDGT repeat protein
VDYDGLLLFAADDGSYGYEMWQSDGTERGTILLRDINPGAASSFPANFARVNPLFFLADDGHGYKLWKSDGTSFGTVKVGDVKPDEVESLGPRLTEPDRGPSSSLSSSATTDESSVRTVFTRIGVGSISADELGPASDSGNQQRSETLDSGIPLTNQLPPLVETSQRSAELEGTIDSGADGASHRNGSEEFVPAHAKVTVVAEGHFSVSTAGFTFAITADMWLPPMVKWYLVAVGEGRYRPGSLPPGYESMIWDYLAHVKDRLAKNQKPLKEMESRLAWQWAEWRKSLKNQNMNPDVLPWSYFTGLADALAAFYQKSNGGAGDFTNAVETMRHNAQNLTIIPVKLPDETLLRARHGEPSG